MRRKQSMLGVLLILCLLLSVTGCGGPSEETGTAENPSDTSVWGAVADETENTTDVETLLADTKAILTGDLTTGQARELMEGNLEAVFHNDATDDYEEMVGTTDEDIELEYYAGLDIEAQVFEQYFSIEYEHEDIRARIVAFYDQVYAKCDFTIGEVTRDEDGNFVATATVRPLDIIDLITEDMPAATEEFGSKYTQEQVNAMTDEEYIAYDKEWAEIVLSVAEENLPDMGYLPERTTQIKVAKEGDYWMLTDESMQELDMLLIQYS